MILLTPDPLLQVTDSNKADYIRLVCQEKMTGAIRKQLAAFLEGFYDIIPRLGLGLVFLIKTSGGLFIGLFPGLWPPLHPTISRRLIAIFNEQELELLLSGSNIFNITATSPSAS